MTRRRLSRGGLSWWRNERGVAAVEFALILPVLLIIYLGGFETVQAVAAYRKLSSTTVQLANVTAQYQTMASTDVSNVFNASAQIMSPYPTSNLSIVLSEITTNAGGTASVVTWSCGYNGATPLTVGAAFTVPTGVKQNSTSYILAQTAYTWTPAFTWQQYGSVSMTDQIYMLPRDSASIPDSGCP